jgi:hypothetical protein
LESAEDGNGADQAAAAASEEKAEGAPASAEGMKSALDTMFGGASGDGGEPPAE